MRVLLTSHGSTGDIYPIIALGRALLAAGHSVRFATTPFFRPEIEAAGIPFVRLPPDWGADKFRESMMLLHRTKTPLRQLRIIYSQSLPYLTETLELLDQALADTDLLVGSYLFPGFRHIAARRGVRFAAVCFCHNVVPLPGQPPETLPSLSWLPRPLHRLWCRATWAAANRVLDYTVNAELHGVRRELNLPKIHGFCLHPADLVLVGVSPGLMLPPGTTPDSPFVFTGYLRHQAGQDDAADSAIRAFTGGQRVPLVTFGSVSFDQAHSEMAEFLQRWPSGKKLLIQAGWAGLRDTEGRPHIHHVGKMSHDQLLRHASAILHHGGAGTTATALHAGVPQLIAPQIADQFFWSRQIIRLGTGLTTGSRTWHRQAPDLLARLESEPAFAETARRCAATLAQEDGPARAVAALQAFVSK